MTAQFEDIDAYLTTLPAGARAEVEAIRQTIRATAPDATEAITYQMPTFIWRGEKLIHVAGWKHHIGMYPIPTGDEDFERAVAPYATAKGTLRFPLGAPVPHDLIAEVVRRRMSEIAQSDDL